MNGPSDNKNPRRRGLSRRDFLSGRGLEGANQPPAQETPPTEEPPTANGPQRKWRPLIMRYPKTERDVEAGDGKAAANETDQQAAAHQAAPAARRRTIPVHRPPGAVAEEAFLDGCTRCEECIKACPHDAIIHAPARMREAAGTPVIDVDRQPCLMCADFPCIAACEPDVLTTRLRPAMGTARITEHLCVAHHGTTCTVCSERCPVEGAITLRDGKPKVREAVCTGCGVCRHVCPAPENAVLFMPIFLRPTPRETKRND